MRFKGLIIVAIVFSILVLPLMMSADEDNKAFTNNQIISLKHDSGKYLSVNDDASGTMKNGVNANKGTVEGSSEKFALRSIDEVNLKDGALISFKSEDTGNGLKYLNSEWINANEHATGGNALNIRIYRYDRSVDREEILCGDEVYFITEDGKYIDINTKKTANPAQLGGKNKFTIYFADGDCEGVGATSKEELSNVFTYGQEISLWHNSLDRYLSVNGDADVPNWGELTKGVNANSQSVGTNEKFSLLSNSGLGDAKLMNGDSISFYSLSTDESLNYLDKLTTGTWINTDDKNKNPKLNVRIYKSDETGGYISCEDSVFFRTDDGKYIDIDTGKTANPAHLGGKNEFTIYSQDGSCAEVISSTKEICNDGVDNDLDKHIDCDDSDCDGEEGPGGTICSDTACQFSITQCCNIERSGDYTIENDITNNNEDKTCITDYSYSDVTIDGNNKKITGTGTVGIHISQGSRVKIYDLDILGHSSGIVVAPVSSEGGEDIEISNCNLNGGGFSISGDTAEVKITDSEVVGGKVGLYFNGKSLEFSKNTVCDNTEKDIKIGGGEISGDGNIFTNIYRGDSTWPTSTDYTLCPTSLTGCGNGDLNILLEECDDGNEINGDGCSNECKLEHYCGNDLVERPNDEFFIEECDGIDLDGFTCENIESILDGCSGCIDPDCDESCEISVDTCGDGVLGDCELCDGSLDESYFTGEADFQSMDESSTNTYKEKYFTGEGVFHIGVSLICADFGYTGCTNEIIHCTDHCSPDLSVCSSCDASVLCGNNQVNPLNDEVCDGENLDHWTCATGGFAYGTLSCNSDCKSLDYSQCGNIPPVVDPDEEVYASWVEEAGDIVEISKINLTEKNIVYMKVSGEGLGELTIKVWEDDGIFDDYLEEFEIDMTDKEVMYVEFEISEEIQEQIEVSEIGNPEIIFKVYDTEEDVLATSNELEVEGTVQANYLCTIHNGDEDGCDDCPGNGEKAKNSVELQAIFLTDSFLDDAECEELDKNIMDNCVNFSEEDSICEEYIDDGECGLYIDCNCTYNSDDECVGEAQSVSKYCEETDTDNNGNSVNYLVTPGTCKMGVTETVGDCSTDSVVTYTWKGTWEWNSLNKWTDSSFSSSKRNDPNYESYLDGTTTYWRYNPLTLSGIEKSVICETEESNTITCPAKIKLPFFGGFSIIVSLIALSLIYIKMNYKVKRRF